MFDIQREERYSHLVELCDIQFISVAQSSYYEELKEFYRSQINPNFVKKKINTRLFDVENEDDGQKVAGILGATFKQQSRLMGLG